jgi:hypothetical protein|nr:MAG TPA: protein of unknown function (DUF948) [Caudoviricetes sp.]
MWIVEMAYFLKEWWFLISSLIVLVYSGWKGVNRINSTLQAIQRQLELSNSRLGAVEQDRKRIWEKLGEHSHRIDKAENEMIKHSERIKSLFQAKGGK